MSISIVGFSQVSMMRLLFREKSGKRFWVTAKMIMSGKELKSLFDRFYADEILRDILILGTIFG